MKRQREYSISSAGGRGRRLELSTLSDLERLCRAGELEIEMWQVFKCRNNCKLELGSTLEQTDASGVRMSANKSEIRKPKQEKDANRKEFACPPH
jgi:hypothetical protein